MFAKPQQATCNSPTLLRFRAGLAAVAALLIQYLFLVPFDRRPAWALLGYLALGALAGLLGVFIFPADRALWRRWRQALASPAMLFALAFLAYGAIRWSFMLISYSGRIWVIGSAWLAVGLALGSMLGILDRTASPARPRAFTSFIVFTIIAGLLVLAIRALMSFNHVNLPSPGGLAPGMPDSAGRVYWPLFFDHIFFGAGPGSLSQFIGGRPSLEAAFPALEPWRWRIPAESGIIGFILFAGFFFSLVSSCARSGCRTAAILASLALLAAFFAPGLGRPESMALVGILAGFAIGFDSAERRLPRYASRLVAAVCAMLVLGSMAVAMTARYELAWRWHLRGDLLMARGQWEEAIRYYEKAHGLQPDNPEHSLGQARAFLQIPSLVGNASPYLVRAGDLDPLRAEVPAALARWMNDRRRWAEAEMVMGYAFALDPTNKDYRRDIARYKVRAVYVPPKKLPPPK